ncbi:MAG: phosphotransferase [Halieaceae bacterium]|jgi:aminoglycoside phosphotransferase (APT) family kinase protein|nr:phosphotransferase [Halieaceae bacterium]
MARQSGSADDFDQGGFEAQCREGIDNWISTTLGGKVKEVRRLERWRPQWKVTYSFGDETRAVLVRGDRPNAGEHDLRFEMEVMAVLEANGIKVPHIHGWVEAPKAFVMDWIETEDRAPGMLHTAIENPDEMTDERWQAMLSYMEHLASVHAVPVSEFSHIRQLAHPPETAADIALRATERMYQAGVYTRNIDTTFEFLQLWLRRNIPRHRTTASFIAGDAGQFMSSGTEVLALLDFEIANIGDTHWDLACFRGRHPYENMGDIPALYRRYAEVSGTEVDLPVVAYHTVAFLQLAGIATKFFGDPKAIGGNWIEGLLEYASITRRAYEAIAELQGIELDYDLHLPEPTVHGLEESALKKLLVDIQRLPTSRAFETWERDLLHAIPEFLLNHSRYRDWFERETMADISRFTGQSFESLSRADETMMKVIAQSRPADDAALVGMMHRRSLRLSMIIAGTDPDDGNPLFHRLDPILN